MERETRNFWAGATWATVIVLVVTCVMFFLVWGNRYMHFEHVHDHVHPPHEHPEHGHPYPPHIHPHVHT